MFSTFTGPSKPRIYDISPNDTIDELSKKMLSCNVSAYPPADITWYKDGKPVPVCRHRCSKRAPYLYTVFSKSNWTVAYLTIAKVTYEDSGAYLCRANNSEGIAYLHTKVHVRSKYYYQTNKYIITEHISDRSNTFRYISIIVI